MRNEVKVLGIDVAKEVFQIHAADARGKKVWSKSVRRSEIKSLIMRMPPCLIGMEACGGAHYWAREFRAMGHEVRLMAPQYVKPYVKRDKDDAVDAEAITEAVTRPGMHFVAVKEIWQQDMLAAHRVRERLVRQRTALINEIRGLLHEYGITVPKGASRLRQRLVELFMESKLEVLSLPVLDLMQELHEELLDMEKRVKRCDAGIKRTCKSQGMCENLERELGGIGPITATAMVATMGDPSVFRNGRQVGSFFGLVPRHTGTGGKVRNGGISKRGDRYIRKLLVHGARNVVRYAAGKNDRESRWLQELATRRGFNKACVALANKRARQCWAIMKKYRRGVAAGQNALSPQVS